MRWTVIFSALFLNRPKSEPTLTTSFSLASALDLGNTRGASLFSYFEEFRSELQCLLAYHHAEQNCRFQAFRQY